MTLMKKYVLPSVATLTVGLSSGVIAQEKNSDVRANPLSMSIQSSIGYNRNGSLHPLASGIIVKYKEGYRSSNTRAASQRVAAMNKQYGVNMQFKRMMSGDAEVISLDTSNLARGMTMQSLLDQINDRDDVEYAELDAWIVPYRVPNDPRYSDQWHYDDPAGGMNLPAAWDETTGSSAVTVAVLDTGYRPHPDLAGNVIGEYDMISSTSVSNDGNGRDSNAQDPGDWTTGQCGDPSNSSWHGTHVAGTVAAVSDNNTGVAGVAWNVNLVPVRVLGTCGGSLSDIADGIRWAAGLSVSGVPSNPNPADVINMSLGSTSPSACSSTYQNAINAAVGQGATVVVAAGNDNSSAGYPPGNCANVISVAATGIDGSRAYYSNFGSSIDVAAPGGDGCDPSTDAAPTSLGDCRGNVWKPEEMVLSTYNSGTQGPASDNYDYSQGTSMAAPHVAGAAALLYSVKSDITPAEVESTLKSTARAFPNVGDHQCTTSNCGAGIVDVAAAVASLTSTPPPPPPPSGNELQNGVARTGLSGARNSSTRFTMQVPAGATDLSFAISGGSGDADLYVRFGSEPTTSTYDCRPWLNGNNETCDISNVQAGTYHVMIVGYRAYSGVSLTGSYTEGSGGGGGSNQTFFENTTNVNIPDNNANGGTSVINVNRSGDAGSITVSYSIVHTWRGDLEVKLLAPNGASVMLHERTNSNDSADNLNGTVNVNAAGVPASGNWSLVVTDRANQDTGYIDSWSIQF